MSYRFFSTAACMGLCVWACLRPAGYAPYALVGVAVGDFAGLFWFGVNHGYCEHEGDFRLGDFAISFLCFVTITVLLWQESSFSVYSEEHANAIFIGAIAGGVSFLSRLFALSFNAMR